MLKENYSKSQEIFVNLVTKAMLAVARISVLVAFVSFANVLFLFQLDAIQVIGLGIFIHVLISITYGSQEEE